MWLRNELKEIHWAQKKIIEQLEDMENKIERCRCLQGMAGPTDIFSIRQDKGAYGRPLSEDIPDIPKGYMEKIEFDREVEECLARRRGI